MEETQDLSQGSLVELTKDECLELLGTQEIGRLAVVDGGYPLVFPVNYVIDDEAVIVRTGPGTKLSAARMDRVGFEVDHINPEQASGWSVLVHGIALELHEGYGETYERAVAVASTPWGPGDKRHVLKIVPVTITGRLLTHPEGRPDHER